MQSEIKIAIVSSVFNSEITEKLLEGAVNRFIEKSIPLEQIKIVKVPGAIEIPLVAKLLAATKKYHAIVCLGAVIRGETSHYDYVCQQVSEGCQQVMLQFDLPVIFGILTTENEQQARARVSAKCHKGIEVADAAIEMIHLINTL